jgi:hypothetical protein
MHNLELALNLHWSKQDLHKRKQEIEKDPTPEKIALYNKQCITQKALESKSILLDLCQDFLEKINKDFKGNTQGIDMHDEVFIKIKTACINISDEESKTVEHFLYQIDQIKLNFDSKQIDNAKAEEQMQQTLENYRTHLSHKSVEIENLYKPLKQKSSFSSLIQAQNQQNNKAKGCIILY